MRNIILFHILACGMLACTPDPQEGERNSGTVNMTDTNNDSIDLGPGNNTLTDSNSTSAGKEITPPDNTQSNEGSKTSGAAGQ